MPLFSQENPQNESGTYVIKLGKRVPASGTASHEGLELSVILSGEVVLGTPRTDDATERVIPAETLSMIPVHIEHYSENRGEVPVEFVYTVIGKL